MSLMRFDEREANNYCTSAWSFPAMARLHAVLMSCGFWLKTSCELFSRLSPHGTLSSPQTDAQLSNTKPELPSVLVLPGGSGVSPDDAQRAATRCALLSSTRTRFSIACYSSPTADELAFESRQWPRGRSEDFLKQSRPYQTWAAPSPMRNSRPCWPVARDWHWCR